MHELLNFQSEKLLRQALTHRSYVNEHPNEMHNERLEFLGDAVLNFVSGSYLYQRYPEMEEGEMTRRRSGLVDEKQLAKFAIAIGINSEPILEMKLGVGALRDGGLQNQNLLSSTFEAVVGAYYLDKNCNIEFVRPILENLFDLVNQVTVALRSNVDAKSELQEWVQAHRGHILPRYDTQRIGGTDHSPEFLARVFVEEELYGEGKASGKKNAEKQAAEDALAKLKERNLT